MINTLKEGVGHIPEFDGARGLLALWVFFAHALELGPYSHVAGHLRAWFAVDIFIVLSGFVIFHLLSQGEAYAAFITRRFFRLFPVFALCFLFALLVRAVLRSHDEIAFGLPAEAKHLFPYLATHAAMLHGMVPEQWLPLSSQAVLPPAWSISVEWQFYLLAPLLFALLARPQWRFAAVLFGLVVVRILIERHSLGVLFPRSSRDLTFNMSAFFPLKLEFFAAGVLSWIIWRRLSDGTWHAPRRVRWLAIGAAPVIGCATGSVALAVWVAVFVWIIDAQFGERHWWSESVRRVLAWKGTRWLGAISYPLYLVHVPATFLVRSRLEKMFPLIRPEAFALVIIIAGALASVGLAWILHVWVEKPAILFGKRLTARRPAVSAAFEAPAAIRLRI